MAKKVLLMGATGMVGGLALSDCLGRPEVAEVTAIGRRPTGTRHPRLTEVLHQDFTDFGAIAGAFESQDVALYCVGAYTGVVPDEEFRRVTVDCAAACAALDTECRIGALDPELGCCHSVPRPAGVSCAAGVCDGQGACVPADKPGDRDRDGRPDADERVVGRDDWIVTSSGVPSYWVDSYGRDLLDLRLDGDRVARLPLDRRLDLWDMRVGSSRSLKEEIEPLSAEAAQAALAGLEPVTVEPAGDTVSIEDISSSRYSGRSSVMRSLLKATPCLVLAALSMLALPLLAQDGVALAPAGEPGCSPFLFDFSTAPEALGEAILTPLAPSEVVEAGEGFKVTSRLFQVVGPDGAVVAQRFGCRAFCAEGEPLGCNPLPGGGCGFCACTLVAPCICNHIQLE